MKTNVPDLQLYQAIRVMYPHLRRPGVVGIIRNGSIKRVYQCCVCGLSDSMDARWPMPKHVHDFIARHGVRCGAKVVTQAQRKAEATAYPFCKVDHLWGTP